jgi:hypothetical protein
MVQQRGEIIVRGKRKKGGAGKGRKITPGE